MLVHQRVPMPHCATWVFNIFERTRLSQLNFFCSVAQCERLHGSSWDWQLDVGQFGRQGLCEGSWDWSLHPKGQGSLQRLSCLRPGTQWAWYLPNGSYSWRNIAIHSPKDWPTMKPAFFFQVWCQYVTWYRLPVLWRWNLGREHSGIVTMWSRIWVCPGGPSKMTISMGLFENIVYPEKPNGFADHYPYEKWLFHWEY